MKFRYLFCATLFAALSLPTSAQEKLSQEQLEAIAIQPASNWGQGNERVIPAMLALFKEEEISFGGKTIKYRLRAPERMEADKKYPMVLWLHGIGEVGTDNKAQLIHLHHIITQLNGEKQRDFFLLVPQHESGDHWTNDGDSMDFATIVSVPNDVKEGKKTLEQYTQDLYEQTRAAHPNSVVTIVDALKADIGFRGDDIKAGEYLYVTAETGDGKKGGPLEFAFAMVEKTVKDYPVDPDRITVSGLSSGGDGTWRALERRPDLFAAAVPLVSWRPLSDKEMEKSPILKKIPIWAIYSSDDSSIDYAREGFERVEKAGANVKKTEFGICGHSAWTPAMLQADIFAWLLSRTKKGGEYTAVYDPGVDPDDMKGIVDVATRDPGKPAMAPAAQPTTATPASAPMRTVTEATPGDGTRQTQERTFDRQTWSIVRRPTLPIQTPFDAEKEAAYVQLAMQYFYALPAPQPPANRLTDEAKAEWEVEKGQAIANFVQCVSKISPKTRIALISQLTQQSRPEYLKVLESLLDGVGQSVAGSYTVTYQQPVIAAPVAAPLAPAPRVPAAPATPEGKAMSERVDKIIEECDRPWAMTTESLYGLFPADWGKESESIPEFLVNTSADDLAKKLAQSVAGDGEDFLAACKSIMALTNKPMSSPWFETGGGRLRSDIKYSLSAKGQMFVRFLRTVKDSGGNSDKAQALSRAATKTLEKIELILATE